MGILKFSCGKRLSGEGYRSHGQKVACSELAFSKHDFLRGAKRRAFHNDPETNLVQYPKFIADVDYKVGLIFGDRASTALLAREIPRHGFETEREKGAQKRKLMTRIDGRQG